MSASQNNGSDFSDKVRTAVTIAVEMSDRMSEDSAKLAGCVAANTGENPNDFVYPFRDGESKETTNARNMWASGYCGEPGCGPHTGGNSLLHREDQ